MGLIPYNLLRSIILSMGVNICSVAIYPDSKYSKAAGSLVLLMPGFFKSSKSFHLSQFLVKTSFSHVCSTYEALTPLSNLLAFSKAINPAIGLVKLLFATSGNIVIPYESKSAFKIKVTKSFTICPFYTICLNVHKYVCLLFIILFTLCELNLSIVNLYHKLRKT